MGFPDQRLGPEEHYNTECPHRHTGGRYLYVKQEMTVILILDNWARPRFVRSNLFKDSRLKMVSGQSPAPSFWRHPR